MFFGYIAVCGRLPRYSVPQLESRPRVEDLDYGGAWSIIRFMRGTEFDHILQTLRGCNPSDEDSRFFAGSNLLRDSDKALMLAKDNLIPYQGIQRYDTQREAMLQLASQAECIVICIAEIDNRHGNEVSDWLPLSIREWLDDQFFPCLLYGRHKLSPFDLREKQLVRSAGVLRKSVSWCVLFQDLPPTVGEFIRQTVLEVLGRELMAERSIENVDLRREIKEVHSLVLETAIGTHPEFNTASELFSWFAKNRMRMNPDDLVIGARVIPLKNRLPREFISYMLEKLANGVRVVSVTTALGDLNRMSTEANNSGLKRIFFQGANNERTFDELVQRVGNEYQLRIPELDELLARLTRRTPAQ